MRRRNAISFICVFVFFVSIMTAFAGTTDYNQTQQDGLEIASLQAVDAHALPTPFADNLHGIQADDFFPFQFELLSYQNGYAVISASADSGAAFDLSVSLYDESAGKEDRLVLIENNTFTLAVEEDYLFSISVTDTTSITEYCGIILADFFMSTATVSDVAVRIRDVEVNEINQLALTNHNLSEMWTPDGIPNADVGLLSAGSRGEYEPNDTRFQATRIFDDEDVYGAISNSYDVDWFVVSFSSAGNANFWLGNIPSGCDYDLLLHASDGRELASSKGTGASELITYEVQPYTDYYIQVISYTGSSPLNYWLREKNYPYAPPVTGDQYEPNDIMQAATYLPANATILANLHTPSDNDFYCFSVVELSAVQIVLNNIPAGCDYDLELYDIAGIRIAVSSLGGTSTEHISVNLPAGAYYIRVYAYSGSSSLNYYLQLTTAAAQRYITYYGNYNTGGTVPPSQPYTPGVPVTIPYNIGGLQRTGFGFSCWNTHPYGTGTDYLLGSTAVFTTVQPVLFAKWRGYDYWQGGFSSASNLTYNYITDSTYANNYILPAINSWNNQIPQVNFTRSVVNPKITFRTAEDIHYGQYGIMYPYTVNSDGEEYNILLETNQDHRYMSWTRCEIVGYETNMNAQNFVTAEKISNYIHEIGHALSLGHPAHSEMSVMVQTRQSIPPQSADIINLRTKWGQ